MENNLEPFMNKKYRVSLRFDPDGYWIAEHPELPGCIADGETAQEALSSLDVARELWIESRLATGLEVPEPQEEPQYSGKFVLRIAKSLHRELAKEADAEGVSLNTHVSNVLAGRNAPVKAAAATQEAMQTIVSNILGALEFAQRGASAPSVPMYNAASSWKQGSCEPLLSPQNVVCSYSRQAPWEEELTSQNSFGQSTPFRYAGRQKEEVIHEC